MVDGDGRRETELNAETQSRRGEATDVPLRGRIDLADRADGGREAVGCWKWQNAEETEVQPNIQCLCSLPTVDIC